MHSNENGGGHTAPPVEKLQTLEDVLRSENMLTRDPRRVERKKYGQPGARKRFQFSKR